MTKLFWGVRFYTNISVSSPINARQTRVQMSLYHWTCWCQRCYILLRFAVCMLRLKRFKATSCIQQTPHYDLMTFTAYIKEHSNRPLLNRALCNLERFGFCLFEEYVNVLTSTSPSPLHWHTSLEYRRRWDVCFSFCFMISVVILIKLSRRIFHPHW